MSRPQALEDLSEAGLHEEQVELLWDLYLRARAQEDPGSAARGASADAEGAQSARLGGLSLGIISRLLITLHLMYQVSGIFSCAHLNKGPFYRAPRCSESAHAFNQLARDAAAG